MQKYKAGRAESLGAEEKRKQQHSILMFWYFERSGRVVAVWPGKDPARAPRETKPMSSRQTQSKAAEQTQPDVWESIRNTNTTQMYGHGNYKDMQIHSISDKYLLTSCTATHYINIMAGLKMGLMPTRYEPSKASRP